MEFSLFCDLESLEISRSGTIWGGVWIEAADEKFPEPGWNDMPVAFTCELTSALVAARERKFLSRQVRFYDGPFWLIVESSSPGDLVVTLGGSDGKKVLKPLPVAKALEHVFPTVLGLLHTCRARGWGENPDVVSLAHVVASLE
ncbi:hypothetical protein [Streptomyces sp. NPDC093544]|uniref:hypothetical protein n=1 Tax=Streptomyces sp. NPDC093544 TaxID=3155200 RepID=UPI00342516C3